MCKLNGRAEFDFLCNTRIACQFQQFLRKVALCREFQDSRPSTLRRDSKSSSKYHGDPHDLTVAQLGECLSMLGATCICSQMTNQHDPLLINSMFTKLTRMQESFPINLLVADYMVVEARRGTIYSNGVHWINSVFECNNRSTSGFMKQLVKK